MDALYFDLDGTLVEYTTSFEAIYEAAFERLDAAPGDPAAYSEAFFDALGDAHGSTARPSGGRSPAARDPFATAIAETDVDVDPAAFSDALVAAEADRVEPAPGASDVLDAFADRYRLGVLTNGVGRAQRAKLDASGLADAVESVVVSGEVGVRKPDPGIYATAEDRLPADGYAFVADDLDRDVEPAIDRGWRGVYVGADDPDGVPSVRSLDGLCDIL